MTGHEGRIKKDNWCGMKKEKKKIPQKQKTDKKNPHNIGEWPEGNSLRNPRRVPRIVVGSTAVRETKLLGPVIFQ